MSKLVRETINEQFHKGKDPYEKYKVGTISRIQSAFKNIEGIEEYEVYNKKATFEVKTEEALQKALQELGYEYDRKVSGFLSDLAFILSAIYLAVDPSQKAKGAKGPDPTILVKASLKGEEEGLNLQTGKQLEESEIDAFLDQ